MNRTLIKKLILILLGNFILAFGVNCFMVSTGIIMGGATGIGLAVNKFTGINLSYVVWVLNFILFFLGLFFMGKAFAMSIILSTFFYPLCLNVLERIPGIMHLTDNLLLADIYGGVLVGLGIGPCGASGRFHRRTGYSASDYAEKIRDSGGNFPLCLRFYRVGDAGLFSRPATRCFTVFSTCSFPPWWSTM